MSEEETKQQIQTFPDNAQTTIETGTLSKEQNDTFQSSKIKKTKKKKKTLTLQLDSKNSFNTKGHKFKGIFSIPISS